MEKVVGPYLGMQLPEDLCFNTDQGQKCLKDYKGKWLLLFSHPADFTPVCTTEFVAFSRRYEEFKKRGVELLGLSVDTNFSHIEWKRQIESMFNVKVPFPIIADIDMKVASVFNAVPPGNNLTVRVVALIDPDLRLAWFAAYPYTNGRNIDEIIRVIDAIQFSYKYGYATPADWTPGKPVIVPPPPTEELAEKRLKEQDVNCKTWWFCEKDYNKIVK